MKTALEKYWKGGITEQELLDTAAQVQADAWRRQQAAGIDRIALDGTLYDQVLDTTMWLGLAPPRFSVLAAGHGHGHGHQGHQGLQQYFVMARGAPGIPALDMTKFYDTNYHYVVPELGGKVPQPRPQLQYVLDKVARGQAVLGTQAAVPLIIGPVTYITLARGVADVAASVAALLPAYVQLLTALKEGAAAAGAGGGHGLLGGVPEVQVHEPCLATEAAPGLRAVFEAAYATLAEVGVPLHLVTYFDDLGDAYPWAVRLPVHTITLDFLGVPGAALPSQSLALIEAHGFPADKVLGAGVVDGRSVWADDGTARAILARLLSSGAVTLDRLLVTSSAPLQLLPYDLALEPPAALDALPPAVRARLAFAVQKLSEIVDLAAAARAGTLLHGAAGAPSSSPPAGVVPPAGLGGHAVAGAGAGAGVDPALLQRAEPYEQRRAKQIQMPAFPTTTIGSFPQTPEVRRLRSQLKSGAISQAEYDRLITGHIAYCVGLQEGLGLDVLVHGEPERTDMVEYFGTKLAGMAFTQAGWVQSYGSRYVRPPIITGDVSFTAPMTIREYEVAQAFTARPVKGMLTGPVTILNWSFPRKDVTRAQQALQLAYALRQEVAALEAAGCRVIQVDEPALREGLPLKAARWPAYLAWAVDAFRLCTAVAAPATQVVTHLCYSDFDDIMPAIHAMDADVLTIENSRSDNAMLLALAHSKYGRDIGAGVYDVHSPVVPTVEFIRSRIASFVDSGVLGGAAGADRIWVNPDCGLKTRAWPETIAALRNMVTAAADARVELLAAASGGASKGGGAGAGGVAHGSGGAVAGGAAGGGVSGGGSISVACRCCYASE